MKAVLQVSLSDDDDDVIGIGEDARLVDLSSDLSSHSCPDDSVPQLRRSRNPDSGMAFVVFGEEDGSHIVSKSNLSSVQYLFEVLRFPQPVEPYHRF